MSATIIFVTGCGGVTGTTTTSAVTTSTTTTTAASATAAALTISASPTTVQSDNSTAATVSVTAISASNAAVAGVQVSLSTDTGLMSSNTVTTDSSGVATFTFKAGGANKLNRTATISATAGTATAQYPIQIVGSTVTLNSTSLSLTDDGSVPATLTVTAKDSAGIIVPNASVVLTQSVANRVSFTPASGVTDASGLFTSTVKGASSGSTTVTASALGATATNNFVVTPTAATFGIGSTTLTPCATLVNNTCTAFAAASTPVTNPLQVAMKIGDKLTVSVNAPAPATSVRFVSSMGNWTGETTPGFLLVTPVSSVATATLTATSAGVATIYVDNPSVPATNASMTVSMTATTAYSITLQASPSLLSKSVGSTKGVSTLIATVTDSSGMPVGDAPISFSIQNPTGGGETVSPAFALSASTTTTSLGLGQASTSFTTGSKSSGQTGVQIRAQVLGTAVKTGTSPSGSDATITIGGSAGSIAFGSATVLAENSNKTGYVHAMSVLVADSNGNPAPAGTVVNLSSWPIAWSTGGACARDADTATTGTFYNEDVNENLILDPTEDGVRKYYANGTSVAGGKIDGLITPTNSAGGTVPGTVTTDANGLATFDLSYGKNSALWITTRIRARTVVQGSEALSEISFALSALADDVVPCKLSNSPFNF
ncbi:MAG: Ig-like domain-containing protein [Gallionellaceae bacterium]